MHYFTHCPIPATGGKDCGNNPHPGNSFGICSAHWRKIADQWLGEKPEVTVECSNCHKVITIDSVELDFAICRYCHKAISDMGMIKEMIAEEEAARAARTPNKDLQGVIYYMRLGDRVKIGFTTNLDIRATQIPNDEVVAAEPGTYELERQRHGEFLSERLSDRGEWFTFSPRLAFHMANVRDQHGDPFEVKARSLSGAL